MINYKLFCVFGLACTIIVALIPSGNAIKCYVCNSNIDKNCSLKTPPDYLKKDCATFADQTKNDYKMCRKITQTIDFEVNGLKPDHRVIRSCAYVEQQDRSKACYQRSGFGGRQEVCTCNEPDYCNNSNNIRMKYSVLFAAVSIVYVFNIVLVS